MEDLPPLPKDQPEGVRRYCWLHSLCQCSTNLHVPPSETARPTVSVLDKHRACRCCQREGLSCQFGLSLFCRSTIVNTWRHHSLCLLLHHGTCRHWKGKMLCIAWFSTYIVILSSMCTIEYAHTCLIAIWCMLSDPNSTGIWSLTASHSMWCCY